MLSLIERRSKIINEINSAGKVQVEALAIEFNVSEVTIRNDLNVLSNKGLIMRSRGGAISMSGLVKELSVKEKYRENHPIKRRLGKAVSALVGPEIRSLLIDSGTTTEEVALNLTERQNMTVMTNGFNVAAKLALSKGVEVIVTGGTLRKKSMSFYGRQAEESLKHMHFDLLVLGIDGIDLTAGITTHFEQEANLNRLMFSISSKVVAVADSSKFEQRGPHIICDSRDIDTLVTDAGAPQGSVDALKASGVEVVIVE